MQHPCRFDIGLVDQDLRECCSASLFTSVGRGKRPNRGHEGGWPLDLRHRQGASPSEIGLATLVLLGNGAFGAAIIVILAGLMVTFVADHFVRPKLIGGATKLPFLWVLLGILGGVESFQLLGLFLGPAIMAALMLLWRELTGASIRRDV